MSDCGGKVQKLVLCGAAWLAISTGFTRILYRLDFDLCCSCLQAYRLLFDYLAFIALSGL